MNVRQASTRGWIITGQKHTMTVSMTIRPHRFKYVSSSYDFYSISIVNMFDIIQKCKAKTKINHIVLRLNGDEANNILTNGCYQRY